jgi:formylglycine-generating enzyme required for sulfatase activity
MLDEMPTVGATAPAGMVLIPAREFLMGSSEGSEFEKPVHRVYLDAYYLDETPVTNAQFAAFVEATGYQTTVERETSRRAMSPDVETPAQMQTWRSCATSDRQAHPVVLVSWDDAAAYAQWAGKRLPTEAEWEKAARGTFVGKLFPWGDDRAGETHTHWNQLQQPSDSVPPTAPVASFPPNQYGLYDMAGNVWEWCADWYANDYYTASPAHNPPGPADGQFRVRRGASWNVREEFRLRCANRGAMPPDKCWPNMGFRCAMSIEK